jgi:iron complex transport system ATP-binding protein
MEILLDDLAVGYGRGSGFGFGRGSGFGSGFGSGAGSGEKVLLEGVDAAFPAGTLTALVGRNGSGKSTLLRVMAGLARPLRGRVLVRAAAGEVEGVERIEGVDIAKMAPRELAATVGKVDIASMAPQKLASTVGFVSTERVRVEGLRVRDVVALGRTPYTDWTGRLSAVDRLAVDEALAAAGMEGMEAKRMDTLSDGEAQRAMIARVLAQDTPIILLDEPTAFLDFVARREVCELLADLTHRCGKTIVFSSHDLALVDEFADRRLEIVGGRVGITDRPR